MSYHCLKNIILIKLNDINAVKKKSLYTFYCLILLRRYLIIVRQIIIEE